jgi:hypothetical protein
MSYDIIDRFLRSNLDDDSYAEYSVALDELCAPPAQRTWVGLTEDEVTLCHSLAVLSKKHDGTDPSFTTLLHQQIEAILKEKNS